MQKVLKTNGRANDYANLGKNYPFPGHVTEHCPQCQRKSKFSKHGFYLRYVISKFFQGHIIIRRYICQCKRVTLSLLPDFCIFRVVRAFAHILEYITEAYLRSESLSNCIQKLNSANVNIEISRQLLYFYRRRFKENIELIEHGLRQINPQIMLTDAKLGKIERANDLLRILKVEYLRLDSFVFVFYEKTHKSVFALVK